MGPPSHLGIDKGAAGTRANTGNVRVVINQSCGINLVKGAFDQVCSAGPNTIMQLLRLMIKGATDEVNQAHKSFEFRVSGFRFQVSRFVGMSELPYASIKSQDHTKASEDQSAKRPKTSRFVTSEHELVP